MLRRMCTIAAVVIGLSLLLSGCSPKPVVGVLLPATGSAANYGEAIESGVRLAIADARNRDELPPEFEIVWADSGSDPQQAVSEFQRLVNERNVRFVIGGATSAEARALIPVLDDLQIICLTPSASSPELTKQSKLLFRIYPSDELEGNAAGKFLYDRLNKHSVLLYVGDSEYTLGIEPEFRQQYIDNLGGSVVDRIELDNADWENASRTLVRNESPEAVYIIGYADDTLEVLRHLNEINYKGRILSTSAFYSSRAIQTAGALAEDLVFPLPPFDRTSEKEPVQSFVNRYMETYQRAPDVFAAHGYDAMQLAIKAFSIAKPPLTSELKKALHFGISDFMGVTGPILFDDHGDVKHYPKMFIVKDGQVLSYQRYMKGERDRILREVQNLLTAGN